MSIADNTDRARWLTCHILPVAWFLSEKQPAPEDDLQCSTSSEVVSQHSAVEWICLKIFKIRRSNTLQTLEMLKKYESHQRNKLRSSLDSPCHGDSNDAKIFKIDAVLFEKSSEMSKNVQKKALNGLWKLVFQPQRHALDLTGGWI